MAYSDFIDGFALTLGLERGNEIEVKFPGKYSFQLDSRERAKNAIEIFADKFKKEITGLSILDVGCAYGAFAIELAKLGNQVVGVDTNKKWLDLAALNAKNEADVEFHMADASSRRFAKIIADKKFDLVIMNDCLEHIYDTSGVLQNMYDCLKPDGRLYFKVPNGYSTRAVISEGHKAIYGISLLNPDYWGDYTKTPFSIYYRRWKFYTSMFDGHGFKIDNMLNPITDASKEITIKHIKQDLTKIKTELKRPDYKEFDPRSFVRKAIYDYVLEVEDDLIHKSWEELFHERRVTFWEGFLVKAGG